MSKNLSIIISISMTTQTLIPASREVCECKCRVLQFYRKKKFSRVFCRTLKNGQNPLCLSWFQKNKKNSTEIFVEFQ